MKLIAATLFVCVATLALMHSVYGGALPQLKSGAVPSPGAKIDEDDLWAFDPLKPIPLAKAPAPAPSPSAAPGPEPSGPPTAVSAPGPNGDPIPASAPQPEMGPIEPLVLDEIAEDMPAGPSPIDGAIEKASEK